MLYSPLLLPYHTTITELTLPVAHLWVYFLLVKAEDASLREYNLSLVSWLHPFPVASGPG